MDADLPALWLGELAQGAMAWGAPPVHIIPGGQVLAAAARAAEGGAVPGIARREDFFARNADGTQDPIHLNDLGAWLIALTHYAVLYHRSPEGLPTTLARADGSSFSVPPDTAAALQALVWQVVRATPRTGVSS